MKRSDIKIGQAYAVVLGSVYEGAEAMAVRAIVLETGVEVENFNNRSRAERWSRRPSSVTNDGVRVQITDPGAMEPNRKTVVKTRNIIDLWDSHAETMRLRAERKAAEAQRSKDSQAGIEEWARRLGMETYQFPLLSGGIQGGTGWNAEYTRNRAALVRLLERAYELGRQEAGKREPATDCDWAGHQDAMEEHGFCPVCQ